MLGLYVAVALLLAASAAVGQAIWLASGFPSGSFLAPAIGFATLLAVAALTVRLPGQATTSAVAIAVLGLLAAAFVARRRAVSRAALRPGAPVALALVVLVSLPFWVSGHLGVLGVGVNNDMNRHLLAAWWLQDPGRVDTSGLIGAGYPLGPHALAATLGTGLGLSLEVAFNAVMLVVPVLIGLAALSALREVPTPERRAPRLAVALAQAAIAVLVGVCYLVASYLAIASFKEAMQGLLVLTFALTLHEVCRTEGVVVARRAIPLGLVAAGSVYTYSYLGAFWAVATVVCLAALTLLLRPPRPLLHGAARRVAAAARPAAWALGAFVAAVALDVPRLITFHGSEFNHEPPRGVGPLLHHIPFLEVMGVWFRSDFRLTVAPLSKSGLLIPIVILALLASLAWWLRRRELSVPAGLLATLLIYWQATLFKSPYAAAKALAIAAPFVMLVLGRGVLAGWRVEPPDAGGGPRRRPRRALAVAAQVAVGIALLGAARSSFIVLRDAPVGPEAHTTELATLAAHVGRRSTLFLGNDDNVNWELRGVNLAKPPLLYPIWFVPLRETKNWFPGLPFDIDSVTSRTLDRFRYVILPRSPYASDPPPNWQPAARTRSYVLWQRRGGTPPRRTLAESGSPGAVLDCQSLGGRVISRLAGVAGVRPEPVRGGRDSWTGPIGLAGRSARQALELGPGAWDVSLQYASRQGVVLSAPGLRAHLPATLDRIGPYWFAGTVNVARPGRVEITVTPDRLPPLGRLLHARGHTLALDSSRNQPLGGIAATPHGARERLVPLRHACGRYVDWYRPAVGSATRSAGGGRLRATLAPP